MRIYDVYVRVLRFLLSEWRIILAFRGDVPSGVASLLGELVCTSSIINDREA